MRENEFYYFVGVLLRARSKKDTKYINVNVAGFKALLKFIGESHDIWIVRFGKWEETSVAVISAVFGDEHATKRYSGIELFMVREGGEDGGGVNLNAKSFSRA